MKNTRRAFVASLISVVLCFAMLVGSTYAWFTDSVVVSNNKISSGDLDIELWKTTYNDWMDQPGEEGFEEVNITDSTEPIFNYDNWEPGYLTYANLTVKNVGSLAAKIQAHLVATEEISALANVIDVYVAYVPFADMYDDYTIRQFFNGEYVLPWGGGMNMFENYVTKVGTLAEVINDGINLALFEGNNAVIESGDNYQVNIAFKMQETAGNEYQKLDLGAFDIRIVATQATVEEDDFDNQYDKDAEMLGTVAFDLTGEYAGKHLIGNFATVIPNVYRIDGNYVENCIITSEIAAQANGYNEFNYCTFTDLFWLDDVADDTTVVFNNCKFNECIKIGGNETVKYVFNNCSFGGPVNWSKALITTYAPTEFNNCTFDYSDGAKYSVRLAQGMTLDAITANDTDIIVNLFTGETYYNGVLITGTVEAAGEASTYEAGSFVVGGTAKIPLDGQFSRLYADGVTFVGVTFTGSNIVTNGDITFIDCTFDGNLDNSVPSDLVSFTGCTFNANVHFASGSGAEIAGSDFVATDCVFNKMVTLADFENATFTNCKFYGNNWAGKNVITYVTVGVNTFDNCTFTTGIRAAGQTADKFVIKDNCNITIADVSNVK